MLFFPPPFPIGISLTILILDKSLWEVIPPALLKTSEIVVIFSLDLLTIRFSDDWLFNSEIWPKSDCPL